MNAKETYTCKCKSGQHLNSCVGTFTHEFMCWPQKSPKGIREMCKRDLQMKMRKRPTHASVKVANT